HLSIVSMFFFFFQAEDGIRDATVTGVQTCALPIWQHQLLQRRRQVAHLDLVASDHFGVEVGRKLVGAAAAGDAARSIGESADDRSEERRVGKEWRSRWWRCE